MKNFLILVDLQRDFVDGALGTPEAVEMLDRATKRIEEFEGEIFVTLDTHGPQYAQTAEGKKLPVPHCMKGTPGWCLHPRVAGALKGRAYRMVEKGTFGAVDLPERLLEAAGGQDFTVELLGLCTDICVVSNALLLKAHFPEKTIGVRADCCAGVTPQSHQAALTTMQMCQIDIL